MIDYKHFRYNEYRIMSTVGETEVVNRFECFKKGDKPTADNPFKQRWFFSPDQGLAIRLPRNELGERIYRYNDTELRAINREATAANACLAQKGKANCPITCANCNHFDECTSPEFVMDGHKCSRKCIGCNLCTVAIVSLDLIVSDGTASSYMKEFNQDNNPEAYLIDEESTQELQEATRKFVSNLSKRDKEICSYISDGKTNVEIAKLLKVTEGAIRKKRKKLTRLSDAAGLKNFL